MPGPLYVYDNWSTYDELSDVVPLTEKLAMKELGEILRLRKSGARFDAYLMDAFWYEPGSGYRKWRKSSWPNGPDDWIKACLENDLLPGLWFPANTAFHLQPPNTWVNSLAADAWGFCCFQGGFMDGFVEVLRFWYGAGIRVFKFDFADFNAAPEAVRLTMLPSEIRSANIKAYREGLAIFRSSCTEAILCAYNGFEEAEFMPWTDRPVRRVIDPLWLDTFDSLYSGDPRPADLPLPNFWRTLDVYADHMVWYLTQGGLRFSQIDNCAFMIGETGTCYRRGAEGWKTTLLLSLIRGGSVHMSLGNLENLDEKDAKWYAQIQSLLENPSGLDWCGGVPGKGEVYGYSCLSGNRQILVLVNPSLQIQGADVPAGMYLAYRDGYADFHDAQVLLGPGSVVLLCSDPQISLGVSDGFAGSLARVEAQWKSEGGESIAAYTPEADEQIHIVFRQFDANGFAVRTSGGSPPAGRSMSQLLAIQVSVSGQAIEARRPDDHIIWSGLSWAYGIVSCAAGKELHIRCSTSDSKVHRIEPSLYRLV